MNTTPKLCSCGCGRIVKHPFATYIKGHVLHPHSKSVNDLLAVHCAYCQKPILAHRWRIDRFGSDNVYCCREHQRFKRQQDALHIFTCEQCGKQFSMIRSRKQHNHVFCGLSCACSFSHPRQRITVTCEHCQKQYEVHPSKVSLNKHFYCCRECRALSIMGQNNPAYRSGWGRKREYSANWKRQRRAAILRDNAQCQVCHKIPKRQRYLHVHHIVPAFTFNGNWEQANDLSNLISLCSTCHKKAEIGLLPLQVRLL